MAVVQAFRAWLRTHAWHLMAQPQLLHPVRGLRSLGAPISMSLLAAHCQPPAEACSVVPGCQSLGVMFPPHPSLLWGMDLSPSPLV